MTNRTQKELMQIERLESAKIYLTNTQIEQYLLMEDSITLKVGQSIPKGYKRCGKCRQFKKLYLFNQNTRHSLNCTGNCKECQKETSRSSYYAIRIEDKDKDEEVAEKRRKEKERKQRNKEYYLQHREIKLQAGRDYYAKNKDKILEGQKKYQKSSRGKNTMTNAHAKRKYNLQKNEGIPWNKEIIIDRDKQGGEHPICVLCGKPILLERELHMEHLIPIVIGGINCFTNVGCAHGLCNLRKTKDAREITVEQVNDLIKRSEDYIDAHTDLFEELTIKKNQD